LKLYNELSKSSEAILYMCRACKLQFPNIPMSLSYNMTNSTSTELSSINVKFEALDEKIANILTSTLTTSGNSDNNPAALRTIGKKLEALEQQIALSCHTMTAHAAARGPEHVSPKIPSYSDIANSSPAPKNSTTKANEQTMARSPNVSFEPDKCVVVHSFEHKSLAVNNIAIRQRIGTLIDNPVITFLNKYDNNDPKLIIQFDRKASVDALLAAWNPETEQCKIRCTQKPTSKPEGICFGVPTFISDEALLSGIQNSFPNCVKVIRFMTKAKRPMGTVKLVFLDSDDLLQVITDGIYLRDFCLKLSVQQANPPRPKPTQCYNCWGYGHYAIRCTSGKICRLCSETITPENDHMNCSNGPRCCNCGSEDHQASDHEQCSSFKKVLQKLQDRATHSPPA
jgi:hypothetical protein